jgi:DNA-directed RNA polymerase specialized sigma24 family protein
MDLTASAAPDVDSDQWLLLRYQQGDREAAAQLYKRYADRLRALTRRKSSAILACRMDPDDIVQSVFGPFGRIRRPAGRRPVETPLSHRAQ